MTAPIRRAVFDNRNTTSLATRLLFVLGFGLFVARSEIVRALPPVFEDRAAIEGLGFTHISPISPERHLHLFMGSGLAWTDFDHDGVFDIVFCQGTADLKIQHQTRPSIDLWRGGSQSQGNYRNVTPRAGFQGTAYAMGVSVADYDNDGFADLFVTGFFAAALYRNNGDGTFSDATAEAGIEPRGFGAGCCWFDADCDGNLDLLYVRYVKFDPEHYPLCTVPYKGRSIAISCNPKRFSGDSDSVYRSLGNGRFEDVTESYGFSAAPSRHGLGCAAIDLDDDKILELYVANDGMPNDLWKRVGKDHFEERGLIAGVAVNRLGASEAGMGVAAGDVDGDLRPDLFVTNYFDETNTLYRNEGELSFLDVTEEMGIAAPSRKRLGFGVTLSDFDNDGWLDLFVANGHVQDQLPLIGMTEQTFAELSQVLVNRNGRRFEDVSPKCGPFFVRPTVARGSAAADVDGDGRVDLAVLQLNDRVALLRNQSENVGNWLALDLAGTQSNRDAIGATVIVRSKASAWRRDRLASASYLSCDSPHLHFGLGNVAAVQSIDVHWPSGRSEIFTDVKAGKLTQLVEGSGRQVDSAPQR